MKKFKVTVTRTVEYEVEVDETRWNAEEQRNWESEFYDLPYYYDPDENPDTEAAAGFAEALAEQSARKGVNQFIEGFGMCADSKEYADSWNKMEHTPGTSLCTEGLYIRVVDDYTECETKEIEKT